MGKKKIKVEDEGGAQKQSYNYWNSVHDEPFLQCLLELTEQGKIVGGMGKVGVFEEIERMMEVKVPGCGLKAKPTIMNRVRKLKEKYKAVIQLQNTSGFGWNTALNCIDADDDAWNLYLKAHPKCKGMNRTPFPHFREFQLVFAKGCANGEIGFTGKDGNSNATSPDDDEPYTVNLEGPDTVNIDEETHPYTINLDEEPLTVNLEDMNTARAEEVMVGMINEGVEARVQNKRKQPSARPTTAAAPAQKKKKVQPDETIADVTIQLKELKPIIEKSADTIARALGESDEQCMQRKDLMKNLEKLEGLSRVEKVLLCRKLNNSPGDFQTFYDLETDENKLTLVHALLGK